MNDRDPLIPSVDRRGFLHTMGGGLLVLCPASKAHAENGEDVAQDVTPSQETGTRREHAGAMAPRAIAAWLHVSPEGVVTAYTGKVEIGQNVRTSLAQVVAEELRVPFDSVRMVMGDTDLVPFDNGTFASQTTPLMGLQLRRAAVAARGALVAQAAAAWGVEAAAVVAEDGRVTHEASARSIAYGELAKGAEFVGSIPEEPALTPGESWAVAGHDVPKARAVDFVTGRHRFASDHRRPGLGHGKALRAPGYGLTLKDADTSRAGAMPGVRVVRDGSFVGVVADDEHTAALALAAIEAKWDGKPPEGTHETVHEHLRAKARRRPTTRGAPRSRRCERRWNNPT